MIVATTIQHKSRPRKGQAPWRLLLTLIVPLTILTLTVDFFGNVRAQSSDTTPPSAVTEIRPYFLAAVISSPRANQVFDVGETITFDARQSQGAVTEYSWSISGISGAPTTSTTTASFVAPGVYWAVLTVRDGLHTRSARVPVTIRRKVAVVLLGNAATLGAVSGPAYVDGRTGYRCVEDGLLGDDLKQTYTGGNYQYSLSNLQAWYDREFVAQRGGSGPSPVEFTIFPTPITVADTPPARAGSDQCKAVLQSYFDDKAADAGLNLTGYHTVAYVFLHDNATPQYFWSCAEGTGAQAGRAFVDFGLTWNQGDPIQPLLCDTRQVKVIAHEVNHTVGSSDTYSGFACQDPNGLAEPDKVPKYPQTKEALMCGHVATSANSGGSLDGAVYFEDLVISPYTATEIGWRTACYNDGLCQNRPGLGIYETAASCADCTTPAVRCTGRACTGGTCQSAALGATDLLSEPGNFAIVGSWNSSPQICDNAAGQKYNFANIRINPSIALFNTVQPYFLGANMVNEPVNITVDVVSSSSATGDAGTDILHAWVSDNGVDWIECPTVTHAKGTYTATVACGRITATDPRVRFRFDTTATLTGGADYIRALRRIELTP